MDNQKNIKTLKEDLTKVAEQISDASKENFSELKNTLSKNLEQRAYNIGEKTREYLEGGKDVVTETTNYLETQAKLHPIASVGIVFCLGWIIGKLSSNK